MEALIRAGSVATINSPLALFKVIHSDNINCLKLLVKSGAKVNGRGKTHYNALETAIIIGQSEEVIMLLYAAGEKIGDDTVNGKPVPDYLLHEDLNLSLKHTCRQAIRKHLLDIDPHGNLFNRIPNLGLPILLSAYLLYNQSL